MTAARRATVRAVVLRERTSGYRPGMARPRPEEQTDVPEPYDPIAEQEEARRARASRDAALTSSERLERLHDLCAQLATMTPAQRRDAP